MKSVSHCSVFFLFLVCFLFFDPIFFILIEELFFEVLLCSSQLPIALDALIWFYSVCPLEFGFADVYKWELEVAASSFVHVCTENVSIMSASVLVNTSILFCRLFAIVIHLIFTFFFLCINRSDIQLKSFELEVLNVQQKPVQIT